VEPEGMVRIGLVHYNTVSEVDRLLAHLGSL
jgi:selenocysteine lyase/cysteine desulfurase